jgi:hypothetical protein
MPPSIAPMGGIFFIGLASVKVPLGRRGGLPTETFRLLHPLIMAPKERRRAKRGDHSNSFKNH